MNILGGNSKLSHSFVDKEKFIQQAKAAKIAQDAAKLKKAAELKAANDKVALSQQSKDLAQAAAAQKAATTKVTDTKVTETKVETPDIEAPKIEGPKVEAPDIEAPKVEAKDLRKAEKLDPKKQVEKIKNKKFGDVKLPAIFFISGFEWFGMKEEGGITDMAEAVEGARHYAWDQKDDMVNEIMKRSPEQKVVLVGYGFGGDTAKEVANDLNTLDNKFRKVDLLITLDPTGSEDNIIPTNVKRNINVFNENYVFQNDDAHVARNSSKTVVSNELSKFGYSMIDQDAEVQEQILHAINTAVG